jgi:hypothetical protein
MPRNCGPSLRICVRKASFGGIVDLGIRGRIFLFFLSLTRLLTFISTAVTTLSIIEDVHGTEHFLHVWHLHGYIMVLYRRTPPTFRTSGYLYFLHRSIIQDRTLCSNAPTLLCL